jgi:hypothetical protein
MPSSHGSPATAQPQSFVRCAPCPASHVLGRLARPLTPSISSERPRAASSCEARPCRAPGSLDMFRQYAALQAQRSKPTVAMTATQSKMRRRGAQLMPRQPSPPPPNRLISTPARGESPRLSLASTSTPQPRTVIVWRSGLTLHCCFRSPASLAATALNWSGTLTSCRSSDQSFRCARLH